MAGREPSGPSTRDSLEQIKIQLAVIQHQVATLPDIDKRLKSMEKWRYLTTGLIALIVSTATNTALPKGVTSLASATHQTLVAIGLA